MEGGKRRERSRKIGPRPRRGRVRWGASDVRRFACRAIIRNRSLSLSGYVPCRTEVDVVSSGRGAVGGGRCGWRVGGLTTRPRPPAGCTGASVPPANHSMIAHANIDMSTAAAILPFAVSVAESGARRTRPTPKPAMHRCDGGGGITGHLQTTRPIRKHFCGTNT